LIDVPGKAERRRSSAAEVIPEIADTGHQAVESAVVAEYIVTVRSDRAFRPICQVGHCAQIFVTCFIDRLSEGVRAVAHVLCPRVLAINRRCRHSIHFETVSGLRLIAVVCVSCVGVLVRPDRMVIFIVERIVVVDAAPLVIYGSALLAVAQGVSPAIDGAAEIDIAGLLPGAADDVLPGSGCAPHCIRSIDALKLSGERPVFLVGEEFAGDVSADPAVCPGPVGDGGLPVSGVTVGPVRVMG